jgi:tRNA(Ile)-lysidine synthetase-like protein
MTSPRHRYLPAEAARVLHFWFHAQDNPYATLWFPPPGSAYQVEADRAVRDTFGLLLQQAEQGTLTEQWKKHPESYVALLVLLDQFSRHAYREAADTGHRNDAQALPLAEDFVQLGWYSCVQTEYAIFAMMPLRHSPTVPRLRLVLDAVDARAAVDRSAGEVLVKFRKQTLRRLHALEDRSKAQSAETILEHEAFASDESNLHKNVLVRTVRAYVQKHCASGQQTFVISLSGGVDSMVLAFILLRLTQVGIKKRTRPGSDRPIPARVIALHINYGNRPEADAEAVYLQTWCKEHGIDLRVETITDLRRGVTPRDEYERESRKRRYASYARCLGEEGIDAKGVFFGHHKGDVQENVISNTFKGSSLLGLAGMSDASKVNGVLIYRPLLPHDKAPVLAFAHRYGVPYFLDSTPSWSNRGKMRNQLMPLARDMFGDGFRSRLSALARQSDEVNELLDVAVFGKFRAKVQRNELCVWVDCQEWQEMPQFFWREAVAYLCHSQGWPMIGAKAARELVSWVKAKKDAWIPVKKTMPTLLHHMVLYLFSASAFEGMVRPLGAGVQKLPSAQQALAHVLGK